MVEAESGAIGQYYRQIDLGPTLGSSLIQEARFSISTCWAENPRILIPSVMPDLKASLGANSDRQRKKSLVVPFLWAQGTREIVVPASVEEKPGNAA